MLNRLPILLALPALLGAAAPLPPQVSLLGEWRNTHNTVHLRVAPCGQALCGTVTWASDEMRALARKNSGKDMPGRQLLSDLKLGKDGNWRGKVFIPAINSSASATVTAVSEVKLRIQGCTLLGALCKTQHWHRIG